MMKQPLKAFRLTIIALLLISCGGCVIISIGKSGQNYVPPDTITARAKAIDNEDGVVVYFAVEGFRGWTEWERRSLHDHDSPTKRWGLYSRPAPFGSVQVLYGSAASYVVSKMGNKKKRYQFPTYGRDTVRIRAKKPLKAYYMGTFKIVEAQGRFDMIPTAEIDETTVINRVIAPLLETSYGDILTDRLAALAGEPYGSEEEEEEPED